MSQCMPETVLNLNLCYDYIIIIPKQESQLNLLRAPMHGMVKSIACEVGDSVAQGTTIAVVEAMKMQNPLFAPMTGKVCYSYS